MSYAAKHYVKIFGRKYTPGEMIDIPIPEEKLKRLLRLKAIEHVSVTAANPTYDNTSGEDGNGVKAVSYTHLLPGWPLMGLCIWRCASSLHCATW